MIDRRPPRESKAPHISVGSNQSNGSTLKLKSPARFARGALVRPPATPPITAPPSSVSARRFQREPINARLFFFVWALDSAAPRVRYNTVEEAERERLRLSKLNPSKTFATYRAVAIAGLK